MDSELQSIPNIQFAIQTIVQEIEKRPIEVIIQGLNFIVDRLNDNDEFTVQDKNFLYETILK